MTFHHDRIAAAPAPALPWRPETAMARVMARRMDQVARHGHAPDKDLKLPLHVLPEHARAYLVAALEDIQFAGRTGKGRQHALSNLERAGAMILAAMDRIQAEEDADFAAMTEPL
ncbi:hypothetical protein [Novosphingobium huizhouense]|uniref:hypothetical protein n=1 Tax=Novosphingobium huizhouense TaxID=2866625 RepID=UPI001CD90898|nr:hypothetical protein [Novosphingobium huizhouense]